jgi:four helix bundle protein
LHRRGGASIARSIAAMGRDPARLRMFCLADDLVADVYLATARFPDDERFGLRSQMRRAAVSIATNIVEGSARRTTAEYVRFLDIAVGSAAETRYLIGVASRLGFLDREAGQQLEARYTTLLMGLQSLVRALGGTLHPPKPRRQSPEPKA